VSQIAALINDLCENPGLLEKAGVNGDLAIASASGPCHVASE
jgi:hypothetical protein